VPSWLTKPITDGSADADYNRVVGIIYCLSLSKALYLHVSSAVLTKLQTNEYRYPVDEFRGHVGRPGREKDGRG
jgi:hypothetical protein